MLIRTQCTRGRLCGSLNFVQLRPLTQKRFLPRSLNILASRHISTGKQTLIEAATAARGLVYMMHTASIKQHLFVYHRISEGKPMSVEDNQKKRRKWRQYFWKGRAR